MRGHRADRPHAHAAAAALLLLLASARMVAANPPVHTNKTETECEKNQVCATCAEDDCTWCAGKPHYCSNICDYGELIVAGCNDPITVTNEASDDDEDTPVPAWKSRKREAAERTMWMGIGLFFAAFCGLWCWCGCPGYKVPMKRDYGKKGRKQLKYQRLPKGNPNANTEPSPFQDEIREMTSVSYVHSMG